MRDDPIEPCYVMLGAKVRMIREALGLDQAELAKRIDLTRPSVSNIEAGNQRVSVHQVEALARAIGTTPKNLMKGIWW